MRGALLHRLVSLSMAIPSMTWYLMANRWSRRPVTGEVPVIVSLTTYGARSTVVHLAVESILAGGAKPKRFILWIDDESILDNLPPGLRRLQSRGLEILLSSNYGPHTKYFPTLPIALGESSPLVIADDDVLYPKNWLSDLVSRHKVDTNIVVCHRAHRITVQGGAFSPYSEWPQVNDTRPSFNVFATGVSGVLYPVSLLAELSKQGERFLEVSPSADDVWLNAVAIGSGHRTAQVASQSKTYPVIPGTQKTALSRTNVGLNENDRQVQRAYSPELMRIVAEGP